MVDILNGIYGRLVIIHNSRYFLLNIRADDVNVYSNYNFPYPNLPNATCNAVGGGPADLGSLAGDLYVNLYSGIITANSLIRQVSETNYPEIAGEARFLRAYSYFKLARFFGTPPLISDIDVNYLIKKPTYKEVYEFIEKDLQKAIELLPDTYTDARIPGETPNKGTAKAMLAEVYLAMAGYPVNDESNYAKAAELAGDVISNADYYNYALLDDYADLWKASYRKNSEIIFGLFFKPYNVETVNSIGGFIYATGSGGMYIPEFKYFDKFPNNYRKYTSMITGQYQSNNFSNPDSSLNGLKFNICDPQLDPCDYLTYVHWTKWIDRNNISDYNIGLTRYGSEITLYLLRYAQTLLTYAEAKARAGELDASAYEAVNMVRRRANKVDIHSPSPIDLTPGLSPEQFADSVVWERAWELGFEPDGRWFDIIRLNLKDSLPGYRYAKDLPYSVNPDYLTKSWYFYKIPQQDLSLDPNLKVNADSTK